MPYPYDNQYQISPEQRRGLLIGSMLAGGIGGLAGKARGNDTLSSMVQGVGSGVMGYGGGLMGLQDYQSKVLNDILKQKGYEIEEKRNEAMIPFYESQSRQNDAMSDYYTAMSNQKATATKEFNTPGDLDTFLASKAGRFGLDYGKAEDRMKMLQLFGSQNTGLSRQYNKWKPSLAPSIYNVIPGYQTPEGQPKTYNARIGIPDKQPPLQKTPSDTDVKFERDYTTADALLDEFEAAFKANKDSLSQNATERITEYPSREVGKALQTEAGAGLKNLESLRIAIMPKMIRALGEVGTLTDADIARANQAIPSINDTEAVRVKGFQQIRDLIKEIHARGKRQENIIPGEKPIVKPPLSAFESK